MSTPEKKAPESPLFDSFIKDEIIGELFVDVSEALHAIEKANYNLDKYKANGLSYLATFFLSQQDAKKALEFPRNCDNNQLLAAFYHKWRSTPERFKVSSSIFCQILFHQKERNFRQSKKKEEDAHTETEKTKTEFEFAHSLRKRAFEGEDISEVFKKQRPLKWSKKDSDDE